MVRSYLFTFSPFHLYKVRSHLFTLSPFHLFTFKGLSLFATPDGTFRLMEGGNDRPKRRREGVCRMLSPY